MSSEYTVRREPPLSVKVGERVRQMLAAQVFAPGDRLVEEDLARRLSVSRTPVREALFRLEQAGLIEQRDGGFHVPRLSLRDVHEIFQLRRLLEPQAVADIAGIATAADLAVFRAGRDRLLAAETVEDSAAANIAFRELWLARIPNRRMQDVLARFDDQVVMVRRATLSAPDARRAAGDGVSALVAAFEAGDAAAARHVMEDFINAALAWFEREVSPDDGPAQGADIP